jgi:hypothetical protein
MENVPSSSVERSGRYKDIILDAWESIRVYENKVRAYYLSIAPLLAVLKEGEKPPIPITNDDLDNIYGLISDAVGLWRDLRPMMKGKDKEGEFMAFGKLNKDMDAYLEDTDNIFKLVETLRDALETLEITRIDKEMR